MKNKTKWLIVVVAAIVAIGIVALIVAPSMGRQVVDGILPELGSPFATSASEDLAEVTNEQTACDIAYLEIASKPDCPSKAEAYVQMLANYPAECDSKYLNHAVVEEDGPASLKDTVVQIGHCYLTQNLAMDEKLQAAFSAALALEPWLVHNNITADHSDILIHGLRERITKSFNECRNLKDYVARMKDVFQKPSFEDLKKLVLSEHNFMQGTLSSDSMGPIAVGTFIDQHKSADFQSLQIEEKDGFFKVLNMEKERALFFIPRERESCVYLDGVYDGATSQGLEEVVTWMQK